MKLTIEAFVSILVIAIGVLAFGQLVNEHSQINEARNYHSEIVDRLESSHFNAGVINDINNEISQLNSKDNKNYALSLREVDDVTVYNGYHIYKVTLTYTVSIPLFGVVDTGVISGYAR